MILIGHVDGGHWNEALLFKWTRGHDKLSSDMGNIAEVVRDCNGVSLTGNHFNGLERTAWWRTGSSGD